ncbi:MAG TPA: tRNA isopentenyl-2-thiomethyl-A-37 hydroxylase MiaE [Polyangiaceae bacterium]|nr:tRNA isopentenyl-2-thiomethyl-A-37 hydroxylase MiaE [Polyangiaceae bacterium]
MFCLKVTTDARWAARALGNLDALLVDHAHCEMKAASNALSLAMRHCDDAVIVRTLTDLAREEIEHFQQVLALLSARGVPLTGPSVDVYAAGLREAVRRLPRDPVTTPLVDRLLVGALIEARSCERFKLLSEGAAVIGGDRYPGALWRELLASEATHYRLFVDLAVRASGGRRPAVVARLDRLAELEAAIVDALNRNHDPSGPATIHG